MDPLHPILPEQPTLPAIAPTPGAPIVDRRSQRRELADRRRREQRRRAQLRDEDDGELNVWDDEIADLDEPQPPGGHIDVTC